MCERSKGCARHVRQKDDSFCRRDPPFQQKPAGLSASLREDGTLILIGATTENPYFEVNGALLSRSRIFELKALEKDDVKELILRAVHDEKKGMGSYHAAIDDDAADFLPMSPAGMPVRP